MHQQVVLFQNPTIICSDLPPLSFLSKNYIHNLIFKKNGENFNPRFHFPESSSPTK